jgi:hypothetical protein
MMIDLGGDDDPFIHMKNGSADMYLTASQEGSYIKFENGSNKILISSDSNDYPLSIGNNFYVKWNGDVWGRDAHFIDAYLEDAFLKNAYLSNAYLSGEIVANKGVIGGWYIDNNGRLEGGKTIFKNFETLKEGGEAYEWTAASPDRILLDASNASIWGGILRPSTENK